MLFGIRKSSRIKQLPIVRIKQNSIQLRKKYGQQELEELVKSINESGIINPITVRKTGNHDYELISGERRLRAAILCGMTRIPSVILNCDEIESGIAALAENIHRCELNFFDEAEAISEILKSGMITRQKLAHKIGISSECLENKINLLKFSFDERQIITDYALTERHASALLRISDKLLRKMILCEVIENSLNVSQTERYIDLVMSDKLFKKRMKQQNRGVIKDIRIFENTFDRTVESLKMTGIDAEKSLRETDTSIEYIIRIKKNTTTKNLTA